MKLNNFQRLVDQLRGRCSTVSLHYLGDPLTHPQLTEMIEYAAQAKLNVHINSHFSYRFDEDRWVSLMTSGLAHLTVCVDGLTQERYEMTRIGGDLELVRSNLERVCRIKRELRLKRPLIEAQHIRFQHNRGDEAPLRRWLMKIGVDRVTSFDGCNVNYSDLGTRRLDIGAPKAPAWLPCMYPYISMTILHDGEVIPCCIGRRDELYTLPRAAPTLGNAFVEHLDSIWNGPAYQRLRAFIRAPHHDPDAFCYGCPHLFETNYDEIDVR